MSRRRVKQAIGNIETEDLGCDLAPACLSCPLPCCRYDVPRVEALLVRMEVYRLHRAGFRLTEIALRVERSNRTVIRILATPEA